MRGHCLCGSIEITTEEEIGTISACHCGMCQRWGSAPFITVQLRQQFELKGKEFITVYESSSWAERTFCSKCGTHLYYRDKDPVEYYFNISLFDINKIDGSISMEIFSDKKPKLYDFLKQDSKKITEAELIESITNLNK